MTFNPLSLNGWKVRLLAAVTLWGVGNGFCLSFRIFTLKIFFSSFRTFLIWLFLIRCLIYFLNIPHSIKCFKFVSTHVSFDVYPLFGCIFQYWFKIYFIHGNFTIHWKNLCSIYIFFYITLQLTYILLVISYSIFH